MVCIREVVVPNCMVANNNGGCQQCNQGYTANLGVCVLSTRIANCLSYSNQMDRCAVCASGYTFNQITMVCLMNNSGNNNNNNNNQNNSNNNNNNGGVGVVGNGDPNCL